MNKFHKQRIFYISIISIGIAIAVSLILFALRQNINVFLTPNEIRTANLRDDYHFRLGGMVKPGSVKHTNNLQVEFVVTDFKNEIEVHYNGILPDLFREGKGVIATGNLKQNIFIANEVLAKHDENYMPKDIYKKSFAHNGSHNNS